jgi:LmeA-like phospholipid-binding
VSDQSSLGEQALSKAAEIGISTQLDAVEAIEVDIQANPVELVQGQVSSVAIEGKGMVMQQDLRMEAMKLETGAIALNPLRAAFGNIELTQPTDAKAYVVLTAEDITRAFNSAYIHEKLQNLTLTVQGQPMTVDTQQVVLDLPGNGKFALSADILLRQTGERQRVAFTAIPQVSADGTAISLTQIEYSEGQGLSPELTDALVQKASELLNLRHFELEGMKLRLHHVEMQEGQLTLQAEALVVQFPSTAP